MEFKNFFNPRSAVIVGSMSPGKLGTMLANQILQGGYQGKLSAVNPKSEGTLGIPGYLTTSAIPEIPDLVIIVSPTSMVASVLDECGRSGIRSAVIISSGFSEVGNRSGEEEITEVARRHTIRFIGPNCAGIANAGFNFFPTLELRTSSGGIGFITQSGALGGIVLGRAEQRKLGISKFISYGNGADLNQVDFLNFLAEDEETKVVALYLESVANGRTFMNALAECSRRKPVIVIKAGRTSAGTRATASHTGSMAGSDAVYDAAIRASGAIRVGTVDAMLDICKGFIQIPHLSGKKIVIVTNSGGPGVLTADHAEEIGLSITEPGPDLQSQLRTFLPGHCSLKNPIDLTVEGTEESYRNTLNNVLKFYDAAVAINVGTPYLDNLALARGVVEGARGNGKPVVACFLPEQLMAESTNYLNQAGIACYPSGEQAVSVLAEISRYQEYRSRQIKKKEVITTTSIFKLPESGKMLEPEAMVWLKENGIPVPDFLVVTNTVEAVQACEKIGFPTVMKVVSPDILHKSDVGGVIVGIQDADAARKAFETIQRSALGKDFRGAVVYPMIKDGQEILLGLSTDPQFGPVVAFGLGGIYTEILKDIVLRIAPVNKEEAMEMIDEIRAIKLLKGARGKSTYDLDTLADTIVRLSQLPFIFPEIAELDLNPVFLFPKGLVIGDVRVIKKTDRS
ncbi:MAG: acetate--CoA ligase family protein [Chloroflexi bacterium]|nr:acetate--CoA ligase family protein [Chloroflexota bacterium]